MVSREMLLASGLILKVGTRVSAGRSCKGNRRGAGGLGLSTTQVVQPSTVMEIERRTGERGLKHLQLHVTVSIRWRC